MKLSGAVMASATLAEICEKVGGELKGDGNLVVNHVASLLDAEQGALTFLANKAYIPQLQTTRATAAIVSRATDSAPCALIKVDNPDLAFTIAVNLLVAPPPRPAVGVHQSATVSQSAELGKDVSIGANAVIEDGAKIGDGCIIYPNAYVGHNTILGRECILYPAAVLYYGVTVGDRVIIHANAVVGSDGFGFAWDGRNYIKIPQVGTVEIGDDVEIGACTTIDRARFGKTVIGSGTKLDNQIQIAHNVEIGAKCAFAAQSGVSGSTKVGSGVMMGGQTGIVGHVVVGDAAIISGKTGVTKSLPGGEHYSGYPARLHKDLIDEWRNVKSLPRLRARVKELEKAVSELKERPGG